MCKIYFAQMAAKPHSHWLAAGGRRELEEQKEDNLIAEIKSLTGKAKTTHTSKAKPGIPSPLPMGRQEFQPSPGKQDSIIHNRDWGKQTPSLQTSPTFSFFPALYAEHDLL